MLLSSVALLDTYYGDTHERTFLDLEGNMFTTMEGHISCLTSHIGVDSLAWQAEATGLMEPLHGHMLDLYLVVDSQHRVLAILFCAQVYRCLC